MSWAPPCFWRSALPFRGFYFCIFHMKNFYLSLCPTLCLHSKLVQWFSNEGGLTFLPRWHLKRLDTFLVVTLGKRATTGI